MKRISIIAGVIALVLFFSALVGASDVVLAGGDRGGDHGKGFWTSLTEEQKEAVQEKKEEMRSQGATREEIHAAIAEMLKAYGIEMPEDCHGPIGLGHGKAGLKDNLTQEQREAIRDKTREMHGQEATREEIHAAVAEMLKGYGIEMPGDWKGSHGRGGFGPGPLGFRADLTDEQREAIHEKTKEMRGQGAAREEIHAAVAEMLKGYGIEMPEDWKGPRGRGGVGPGPGGFWAGLTEEQRDAIHDKIKEMQDQDASRGEIHAAAVEMLKSYGIDVPEDWKGPHGPGGLGPGPGGFWGDLTDEQRDAIHEKIKEMRDQDATREEIRDAVAEMLKAYGIDVPEDWKGPRGRGGVGPGPGGFWAGLTEEQREAVQEKRKEMRSQGASREEIHAAIAEMLKGYGIDVPEDWGEGRRSDQGQRCRLTEEQREIIKNLADEQRRAVRNTIREMRQQGATCEEIQEKVDQMLEGYGIESPGDSESSSSENASAKASIQARSYPNPFNPETEIAYTLSSPEIVQIQIYNIGGQVVRTFEMGHQTPGSHSVRWDGRNENGEPAASGIYFFRIDAGQDNVTNRMVLLR